MNVAEVLSHFRQVHRVGDGWGAKCPAHEDRNPSLSIREVNGKILVHCHAGCPFERVIEAAGLKIDDLFPDSQQPRVDSIYDYTDETGKLLFGCALRPKGFSTAAAGRQGRMELESEWRATSSLPFGGRAQSQIDIGGRGRTRRRNRKHSGPDRDMQRWRSGKVARRILGMPAREARSHHRRCGCAGAETRRANRCIACGKSRIAQGDRTARRERFDRSAGVRGGTKWHFELTTRRVNTNPLQALP